MHILLIHQVFATPLQGGGTRHFEIANFLSRQGHRLTIFTSNIEYISGNEIKDKYEFPDGITVKYISGFKFIQKGLFNKLISFIYFSFASFFKGLFIKDIDVVYATTPPIFQAFSSMLIAKLKRKPLLLEIRDIWVDSIYELGVIKYKWLLFPLKLLEKFLLTSSDKLIVNSPGIIPFIEKDIGKRDIEVVPNGVNSSDFIISPKDKSKYRKKWNLTDKFIVVYTGTMGIANDINVIIESAKLCQEYSDISFVFIGYGIYFDKYKKEVEAQHISNVYFYPPVIKKEMKYVLSSADVCIATLSDKKILSYPYPNKVFDYMAAKKPTIISANGVICDVIRESDGGTVITVGSAYHMAKAIVKYFEDDLLVSLHGNNAFKYVKRHFERDEITIKLESILESLTTNKKH